MIVLKDRTVTKRRNGKTDQARSLRRTETLEEILLWGELRNRLLNGYKFTRQVPLGPYVVDFLCREKTLIVELDGGQHAESTYDGRRTDWLNQKGYAVLRFWNHEVRRERRAVLDTILGVLTDEIFARDEAIRFSPSTLAKEE